ncbi:Golgin subfamily A member 7, variant 2 [Basidiobolus ranarum]|uniref:Ras modification protein ERF4 n=1 Tax=Basidiobolus ranarum TaxID=34480 RepID=A0ABR2WAN4_9FUNG
MNMNKEDNEVSLEQGTLSPTVDTGSGGLRRLSIKRMSSDFTSVVISRLSYVFGENIDLSEDEDMDEAAEVAYIPTPLPFTGKLRIERDYTIGEGCQFSMEYPPELMEKVSLPQFQESISKLNSILYRAECSWIRHSLDHLIECLTLYTYPLCFGSYYHKCMREFDQAIEVENDRVYAPVGLKLWNPRRCAYHYVSFSHG